MKSRLEKSSRVKLGPLGKTDRDEWFVCEVRDALSGMFAADGSRLPAFEMGSVVSVGVVGGRLYRLGGLLRR